MVYLDDLYATYILLLVVINWFVSLSPIKGFKSKAIIVLRTREAHASPIPLEVCMDPLLEFTLFGRRL